MATPGARIRLTVEVLPLGAENAHGPSRDEAVAAFKGRKFALPVLLDDTLERVWRQIEQRYKTNYLNAQQATAFTIRNLQDAYDCDLDLGDTVSSIFEGEINPANRMIKVVPAFVNRDFSVPATSNLRPASAQKRPRETSSEHTDKRRRVDRGQRAGLRMEPSPLRDQPVPTTESEYSGAHSRGQSKAGSVGSGSRPRRSQSGSQVAVLNTNQTGGDEFGPGVKEESPELGLPHRQPIPGPAAAQASLATNESTPKALLPKHQPVAVPGKLQTARPTQDDLFVPEAEKNTTPLSAIATQRDIFDVPSSPEFTGRLPTSASKVTYGRAARTPNIIQKEVDLLNKSRRKSHQVRSLNEIHEAGPSLASNNARAFRMSEVDEIESTPQEGVPLVVHHKNQVKAPEKSNGFPTISPDNGPGHDNVQTPRKATSAQVVVPGSLKKPSRELVLNRPGSATKTTQFDYENYTMDDFALSSSSKASKDQAKAAEKQAKIAERRAKLLRIKHSLYQPKLVVEQTSSQRTEPPTPGPQNQLGFTSVNAVSKNIRISSSNNENAAPPGSAMSIGSPAAVPEDASQLSVRPPAPRRMPFRSPGPLSSDARHPMEDTSACRTEDPLYEDAEVFKKPTPRPRKLKSGPASEVPNAVSPQRRSSKLHVKQDTAPRSKTPPVNHEQVKSSVSDLPAGSSDAGTSTRSTRNSKTNPLSSTPQSKIESLQTTSRTNGIDNVLKQGTPITLSTPSVTRKPTAKRGRPKKSSSVISTESPEPTPVSPPETSESTAPAPVAPIDTGAIVISSAEPSSSEYVDSEDEARVAKKVGKQPVPRLELDNGVDHVAHPVLTNVQNGPSKETGSQADMSTWNTQSWDFESLDKSNGIHESRLQDNAPHTRPDYPASDNSTEIDFDTGRALDTNSKSRSASPAVSTRSSPAVTRRPARFLSHSPTPDGSDGDDDSEQTSAAPSKAATPQVVADVDDESESDSSSNSNDSGPDDEDVEMPDALAEQELTSIVDVPKDHVPSSPPHASPTTNSTPLVPETSQGRSSQVPHKTPVPLPQNGLAPSSQSISAQAATRRHPARFASFGSIRDQLADAKKSRPTSTQKKPPDLRTFNLTKLVTRKNGLLAAQVNGQDDDSSDDDRSSSSSSSD